MVNLTLIFRAILARLFRLSHDCFRVGCIHASLISRKDAFHDVLLVKDRCFTEVVKIDQKSVLYAYENTWNSAAIEYADMKLYKAKSHSACEEIFLNFHMSYIQNAVFCMWYFRLLTWFTSQAEKQKKKENTSTHFMFASCTAEPVLKADN